MPSCRRSMPALREVQSSLMHALMRRSDGSAAQALLRPGTVPSTQRRLQIYRNNLFETRIAAIGAVYPVVARLVGTDLIRSPYPILRIWQANQPGALDAESRISLDEGGVNLLVVQQDLEIEFRLLDEGESRWLWAVALGDSLEQATREALDSDPTFDLAAALSRHLAGGLFVGLSMTEADQSA